MACSAPASMGALPPYLPRCQLVLCARAPACSRNAAAAGPGTALHAAARPWHSPACGTHGPHNHSVRARRPLRQDLVHGPGRDGRDRHGGGGRARAGRHRAQRAVRARRHRLLPGQRRLYLPGLLRAFLRQLCRPRTPPASQRCASAAAPSVHCSGLVVHHEGFAVHSTPSHDTRRQAWRQLEVYEVRFARRSARTR